MTPSMPPDGFLDDQNGPPDGFADDVPPIQEQSTFDKINYSFPGVRRAIGTGIDVLNAPFEAAGEATTMALGGGQWQAPKVLQNHPALLGAANALLPKSFEMQTGKEPVPAYTLPRRFLKYGTEAIRNLPQGPRAAMQAGTNAFYSDQPLDVATDVGASFAAPETMAAPMTAAVKGVGLAAQKAKPLFSGAGSLGRKTAASIFGVSDEAARARINRPEAIKAARDEAAIAGDLERGYRTVEGKIKGIEKQVEKTIRTSPNVAEGATPKQEILNAVENARKKIGFTVTPQEKYAKQILDEISDNLSKTHETVSEKQLRDIVQKISDATKYGQREYGTKDLALSGTRFRLDQKLKKNEGYRDLMREEAPLMRLKNDLIDRFGLTRSVGEGMVATDTTASKLKGVLSDTKKVESQRILERLQRETGQNYVQDVRDWQMAKQFQPGRTRSEGSRRVNIGGIVGSAIGAMFGGWGGAAVGSGVGAVTGSYLDRQGGAVFAKLIDAYLKTKRSVPNLSFREFLPLAEPELVKRGVDPKSIIPVTEEVSAEMPNVVNQKPKSKIPLGIAAGTMVATEPFLKKRVLDKQTAADYLDRAGGDPEKALRMAEQDGY